MHRNTLRSIGTDSQSNLLPTTPRSLEEAELSEALVAELIMKIFLTHGDLGLVDIAQRLLLPANIVEEVLAFLRAERLVELRRRGSTLSDADYGLSEVGRARATEYFRRCRYAGPAPVTLKDYKDQILKQSIADMTVSADIVAQAYTGLVVSSDLRDLLGAAMNSGKPIFMYGPAGSGKTYLAESLVRLLRGDVYVPYAITVDGEIIQVFDPQIHHPVQSASKTPTLDNRSRVDERWVRCTRPVVIHGGELTLPMLSLQYDQVTGFYHAPAHVKSNNGLFIIDDLGRQLISPEQLMNRWIVPMEHRRDYLMLHTGTSFEVPFDVKLVFSTNLPPDTIADEAFLRRLGYKIHVGPVGEPEYRQIFLNVCAEYEVKNDEASLSDIFRHILALHRRHERHTVACYPRDLVSHVRDFTKYRNMPLAITPDLIDWAWDSYFASQ